MDHRAGLALAAPDLYPSEPAVQATDSPQPPAVTSHCCSCDNASPVTVRAEQAIFTSMRSPMGEGYRLVAASPSITTEERSEITRRSPSHASLCDSEPSASAVACYRLAAGRYCIAWSRHAGKEQTARGGFRVHTHIVVLEPAVFEAFAYDALRVQAALAEAIGDKPELHPNPSLPVLMLNKLESRDTAETHQDLQLQALKLVDALKTARPILAVTSFSPIELMRCAISLLPAADRQALSFSTDLHYASSRQLNVTCVKAISPDERRAIQGRDILTIDLIGRSQ